MIETACQLISEGLQFLIIFLEDERLRPQIETLIKHHGLDNKVKITGWASSDDVQKYMIVSRVLVLPNFAQGLPTFIMDALALGRPVFSAYVAGIP